MNPIDQLREDILALVAERQELRTRHADRGELEANRQELVRRQWELAHALIALHIAGPKPAAA